MNLALSIALACAPCGQDTVPERPSPPIASIRIAAELVGLDFTDDEVERMRADVEAKRELFARLWRHPLDNEVAPAITFTPVVPGVRVRDEALEPIARTAVRARRPDDLAELAFADVATLSALVRSRAVSCRELAELSLARLERLDDRLHCVIELCTERALAQADRLDQELDAGRWRGPLHGIPWGAKDLLAVRGTRTTWGAQPFRDQRIDADATVVSKLDEAGAILVAKLSLGALAWGDVWFGGQTRNPWNLEQGSSGSSAGPSSAVAAGCVAFAIGSETCGSILSPSARCGNTSLRPTFGRVSRHGAMALSWSMDKLGPIARSAVDLNLILPAIVGPDPLDEHAVDRPWQDLGPQPLEGWRIGFLDAADAHYQRVLDTLAELGAKLVPAALPTEPAVDYGDLLMILNVEAAAAFDELTRDGRDDELVRQVRRAWPNVFRHSRLVPAVEYVNANRIRRELMIATDRLWDDVDVLVHPTTEGGSIVLFNLTGNPTGCAPSGFRDDGTPTSVAFTGPLFADARVLAALEAWQRASAHHRRHPEL